MIWISTTPDAVACPPAGAISPWLVDDFLESRACWREAAARAHRDCAERITGWPR
jgi:hypothetical protein